MRGQKVPMVYLQRERLKPGTYKFWTYIFISIGMYGLQDFCKRFNIALTLFAGLMSGLTVGYLSIDELVLQLKLTTGTLEEKKNAKKVLPILHKHHFLLVTLLLCNAAAMEALPIFLDAIVPSYLAIIISVTAVLFFGEIIPQAVCTGPNQIKIAATVAPFTKGLMYISFLISYPISLLLDLILGKHSKSRFLNTDLKALIELHSVNAISQLNEYDRSSFQDGEFGLCNKQTEMIKGAIDLKVLQAGEKMIEFQNVYALSLETQFTQQRMKKLRSIGYSRIPVYRGDNKHDIVGVLLMKQLVGVNPEGEKVKNLRLNLKKPLIVPRTQTLDELLVEFGSGKSHMAIVTNQTQLLQQNIQEFHEKLAGRNLKDVIEGLSDQEIRQMFGSRNGNFAAEAIGIITLQDVLQAILRQQVLKNDIDRQVKHSFVTQLSIAADKKQGLKRKMSKSFIQDYSVELSRIFQESKGRTSKLVGMTKLGAVSKPVSHYTGSPRINDISRNSGTSDLHTNAINSIELHNFHHHHHHHHPQSQQQQIIRRNHASQPIKRLKSKGMKTMISNSDLMNPADLDEPLIQNQRKNSNAQD